jgi:3-deoxy-D-manno-octulosonic-acid transferase
MGFVYSVGIKAYSFLIFFFSFFNKKAKLWHEGQKDIFKVIASSKLNGPTIWFHFASLGEFEQGRPVLEKMKALAPEKSLVITFFSPSGFEIRKNYPLADLVLYLPLDTERNAKKFVSLINPEFVVFTKYEYWYYYYKELNERDIPLYVISSIFRKEYSFFKWYGILNKKILSYVSHFFVQDQISKELLEELNIKNSTVSGDTRFDRVYWNSLKPKKIEAVEKFIGQKPVFIAGSTWPEDEKLIAQLVPDHPSWKFIIAPHEIRESKLKDLEGQLQKKSVRYSEFKHLESDSEAQVLIIDNIGMLSSLYQYGYIAYIGGGFGVGIHNTLEAAAFGMPVIFGPNYRKFLEAIELIETGAAFSIQDIQELRQVVSKLLEENYRKKAAFLAAEYVKTHTGATDIITGYIINNTTPELKP